MKVIAFFIFQAVAFAAFSLSSTFAANSAMVERGRYLVRGVMACGSCHTPRDDGDVPIEDRELAGRVRIPGILNIPNITPDSDTGIGQWTDQQIIDAIRNGVRPDGSQIGLPMPTEYYRATSDNDAKAVVVYLRTLRPIRNKITRKSLAIPPAESKVTSVRDVPAGEVLEKGRYMVWLGHCLDCHTCRVKNQSGKTQLGGGGKEFALPDGGMVTSPNITSGNPYGVAQRTDEQIKTVITTGEWPERPLSGPMPFRWYKNISSEDLDAMVTYLRSMDPVIANDAAAH